MRLLSTVTLLCAAGMQLLAQNTIPEIRTYKLSNGMSVWLSEDHSQPKIEGAVVVKAGAKDSPDTGIAHYFEHIMFKGTDNIGTVNYAAEKIYLDSIESKYNELSLTDDAESIKSIQSEINRLSILATQYAIPNEFDRLISRFGGSDLNAYTSYDITCYFNAFSPGYEREWAELNSERLINPVFRLFQSELETVYEEKNMYSDNMFSQALEKVLERFFAPHPYQYSIVGSTENLKKPNLTMMREFFNTYYVGKNMGLFVCGDFKTDSILPILEEKFGRINAGSEKNTVSQEIPAFNGREEFSVKIPFPLVKAFARCYRGVPSQHEDKAALTIACRILNNENNTGYLDQLTADDKLLEAMVLNFDMTDAGAIAVVAIPKLMFQTYSKAEKIVMEQIDRIKNGDFSDDMLTALKNDIRKNQLRNFESIDDRSELMIELFGGGSTYEEYKIHTDKIEQLTKQDIIDVANKYFTDDYLYVKKKKGRYPKDQVEKPAFDPIPVNTDNKESAYAVNLEKNASDKFPEIKLIDFNTSAEKIKLNDYADLYITENNINPLFNLTVRYKTGTLAEPALEFVPDYLNTLGTDSVSYKELCAKLQKLGSTIYFSASAQTFDIQIDGFDENFNETILLLAEFIDNAKGDKKMLKQIASGVKMGEKAQLEDTGTLARALASRVMYGESSPYLKSFTSKQIKKMDPQQPVDIFKRVTRTACSVHYSGSLPKEDITAQISSAINADLIDNKGTVGYYNELVEYDRPVVYFFDTPKSRQAVIYGYTATDNAVTKEDRVKGELFNYYFGGGDMTSLMFQEVREFRSLAYSTGSRLQYAPAMAGDKKASLMTMLSTQNDKSIEAMTLVDSLTHNMPVYAERFTTNKRGLINSTNNRYPTFREVSKKISEAYDYGYSSDVNSRYKCLEDITEEQIVEFYQKNIKNANTVYIIVGNKKALDMDAISRFGEIIEVKKNFIFR